nr:MAG TPA: hypothetical protein [Caudoviricetes sp.]
MSKISNICYSHIIISLMYIITYMREKYNILLSK